MSRLLSHVERWYSEPRDHRHCMRILAHRLESEPLVVRLLVRRGAQADGAEAVGAGALEQRLEQLSPRTLSAPRGNDRDRHLRRLLVDKPEAGLALGEEAVPSRAVGVRAIERH